MNSLEIMNQRKQKVHVFYCKRILKVSVTWQNLILSQMRSLLLYILIVNNCFLGHKECSKVSNGKKNFPKIFSQDFLREIFPKISSSSSLLEIYGFSLENFKYLWMNLYMLFIHILIFLRKILFYFNFFS